MKRVLNTLLHNVILSVGLTGIETSKNFLSSESTILDYF